MDELTASANAAPTTGDAAASPGTSTTPDAEKAKRDAAAAKRREARKLAQLERDEKRQKKLAKLEAKKAAQGAAQTAQPSPADQTPTPTTALAAPAQQQEGWPHPAKVEAAFPMTYGLVAQARDALAGTRYGVALAERTVPQPDGGNLRVDPVANIARPLAAVMVNGDVRVTPGQALVLALVTTLGPVAFMHAVELGKAFAESRAKRHAAPAVSSRSLADAPKNGATSKTEAPSPAPAAPTRRGPASATVDFTKGEAA